MLTLQALIVVATGVVVGCQAEIGSTGRLEVIAAISEPDIVRRILDHLDLPSTPPQCKPARGPPEDMPLFEN
jgi:hypothetical protein